MRTCTSVWRRGQRPLGVVREPGATESVAAYAERARVARRSRRIGTPPRGECREGGIPFGKTAGDFDGTPVKPEPYGETTSPPRRRERRGSGEAGTIRGDDFTAETQRTQRKRRVLCHRRRPWWNGLGNLEKMPPRMGSWQA